MTAREIEDKIIAHVIDDAIAQGYRIGVFEGEDYALGDPSTDKAVILAAMRTTDEDYLLFFDGDEQIGWARFIYGNGADVLSDYNVGSRIEAVVRRAEVLANVRRCK